MERPAQRFVEHRSSPRIPFAIFESTEKRVEKVADAFPGESRNETAPLLNDANLSLVKCKRMRVQGGRGVASRVVRIPVATSFPYPRSPGSDDVSKVPSCSVVARPHPRRVPKTIARNDRETERRQSSLGSTRSVRGRVNVTAYNEKRTTLVDLYIERLRTRKKVTVR